MKSATITDFRNNMKDYLEAIESDQDFLFLSSPKQKGFVVMSIELFDAMQETAHLLSTQSNANRLMKSIKQDQLGMTLSKARSKHSRK